MKRKDEIELLVLIAENERDYGLEKIGFIDDALAVRVELSEDSPGEVAVPEAEQLLHLRHPHLPLRAGMPVVEIPDPVEKCLIGIA